MPTYTYKREDGTTFDLQQKISAYALTTCPTTGQAVKRVITGGGGVVYKGDGWYVTDYKNKGTNPASSAASTTDNSSSNETSESMGQTSSDGATSGESSTADNNAKSSSK
jgi:putative FmdB family regulatory protein